MNIKKGDKVKVIAGNDKGKIGKVLRVFKKKNTVIVENVRKIKKHQRPNDRYKEGGIIETEAPIHVSNVMLVCEKCGNPTRVGKKVIEVGNKTKKVRYCKRCGEIVDEI